MLISLIGQGWSFTSDWVWDAAWYLVRCCLCQCVRCNVEPDSLHPQKVLPGHEYAGDGPSWCFFFLVCLYVTSLCLYDPASKTRKWMLLFSGGRRHRDKRRCYKPQKRCHLDRKNSEHTISGKDSAHPLPWRMLSSCIIRFWYPQWEGRSGETDTWPRASVPVQVKEVLAVLIERRHLKKVFLQFEANPADGVFGKAVDGYGLQSAALCVIWNQDFPGHSLKCTHI